MLPQMLAERGMIMLLPLQVEYLKNSETFFFMHLANIITMLRSVCVHAGNMYTTFT